MKNFFSFTFLIRIGLAFVFMANALTAFLTPSEFIEIINGSFITSFLPFAAKKFVIFIGLNDGLVSLLLFLNVKTKTVAAWAIIWIIGVLIVRGFSLDALEELGFLFMAISLAIN